MAVGDIHNREGRLQNTIKRIETSERISDHNREVLLNFKDYLYGQDLSKDRICRYLYNWYQLCQAIDWKLDQPDKDNVVDLVGDIHQDKIRDRELSPYTKMEYKKSVRKLLTDYLESKKPDFDGEELCDFFTLTVTDKGRDDPASLPTPETIKKLVAHASGIRDRAFMMVLWSSAGRIGEVLGLKWKDVDFRNKEEDEIAKIHFRQTKTKGNRKVPLRAGYLYLKQLKEQDPRGDEPEAFVFRNKTSDSQLSHNAATTIISRAREKANENGYDIDSKIQTNPHQWRKGRATYLAARGMNQSQLCEFGGWVQGSQHVSRYIRLAKSDVEKGLKEIYGMEEGDDELEEDLLPLNCPHCGQLNKWEADSCNQCGKVLKTSELFTEVQVQESKKKLRKKIIEDQVGLDDEKINEKAKEIVAEEVNVDIEEI